MTDNPNDEPKVVTYIEFLRDVPTELCESVRKWRENRPESGLFVGVVLAANGAVRHLLVATPHPDKPGVLTADHYTDPMAEPHGPSVVVYREEPEPKPGPPTLRTVN